MKKKTDNIIFAIVLCVLISSFILGLIFVVLSNTNKQEFKITKEVCENESYYPYDLSEIRNKYDSLIYEYYKGGCDEIIICSINCYPLNKKECKKLDLEIKDFHKYMFTKENKTICKQIPVDEIEYFPYYECSLEYGNRSDVVYSNIVYGNVTSYCIWAYNIKLKKDITIEWIENNCRGISGKSKESGKR